MDPKIYQAVKEEYAERRRKAQREADERRYEVYEKIPELKKYDSEMLYLARTLVGAGDKAYEKLNRIEELTKARALALTSNGYPEDYTSPKYSCSECNDTGYKGTRMCNCIKAKIRLESLKESGLGKLAETQRFDNFSLEYYAGTDRDAIERNLGVLRGFAENFSDSSDRNFILIGGTGLGKTHLSTAVAVSVIGRGYDVVYTTVINMIDDFAKKSFSSHGAENENLTDRYFDCDLLIIDDLGSELSNQFTVSALYNLLNTRLNEGKPTIMNTNLVPNELQAKYDSRITSRILGHFSPLLFKGEDVRRQKLAQR